VIFVGDDVDMRAVADDVAAVLIPSVAGKHAGNDFHRYGTLPLAVFRGWALQLNPSAVFPACV
jgi:hypothetical protein